MNRRLVLATALLMPALVFVSCKDDGNSNPVGPNTPNTPSAKVAPTAQVSAAPRINVAAKAAKLSSGVNAAVTGPAPHDPLTFGVRLVCFSGVDVGPPFPGIYGGIGFSWRNNRGCELNNFSGASDPDGTVSGAFPASRAPYTGKLLTAVRNLTFYYAGGPQLGGAPRLNIPIDECEDVTPVSVTIQHFSSAGCPDGSATDGFFDATAFTDNSTCNDGDFYVGAVKMVSDPTCNINYKSVDYPNWETFIAAFPGARIARRYDAITSGTGSVEPADILILTDQVVHFHVHRATFN